MEAIANPVTPLLRTDQVYEMEGEKDSLRKKLASPHIEDKGAVAEQLRRLERQLDTQRPREYVGPEIDVAIRREAELRAQWTQGMLSQEEMRKCPPGAVDRHRRWEKANKRAIAEWQNIQRRLTVGSDDHEAASIERFRPTTSTMNLDNALIQGKQFFLPPHGAAMPVTFTDAQIAALHAIVPDLAARLATLTNAQRAEVKEVLDGGIGLSAPAPKKNKGGRPRKVKPEARA